MTNYKTIPTWNEGVWEETEFQTIDDFRVFIDEIFIEPGKYEFDETSFIFNVNFGLNSLILSIIKSLKLFVFNP